MTRKVQWNSDALPYDQTLDQVLYEVRRSDAGESLLLDAVSTQDIIEDSDGALAFDALVTPYAKLERKMEVLQGVMVRSGESVKPVAMQVTEPFKQRGVANVAAIFELSDGQTVSIFFHNPDVTPNKMAASDEVISWKWLLNKKDITIVVAPERGEDLNIREVARRIIRLAEKNSPAFQRANGKRAERMQGIQTLKDEITALEAELATAQHDLEVAKVSAEDAQNKKNRDYADAVQQVSASQDAYLRATENGGTDPKTGQTKEALAAQIDRQSADAQRLRDIANGVTPVAPATEDGPHYSAQTLKALVESHGWEDTGNDSVVKAFPGVGPLGGQMAPDGTRKIYAGYRFDERKRYIAAIFGDDQLFDIDGRDREPADVARELNERVEAWVAERQAANGYANPAPAAASAAVVPDLSYRRSADGLFTTFLPNTPEGEKAWRTMNATQGSEGGKILAAHTEAVIQQIRDAGYTVAEDTSGPTSDEDAVLMVDALFSMREAAKPIAPADPRKLPFEWIEHQRAPAMRLEGSKSGFVAVPARGNRDAGTWNIVNTATGEVVRKIQKPKFARSDAERDLVSREEAARYGAGGYYAALQQYDKDLKAFEEAETAKLWANAPAIADVAAELQKIKGWDVSQSKRHEDEGALWIGNYANSRADTELMQDITREIWLNGNPIPKELASASAADVAAWIHVQEAVFAGDEEAAIDELADRYDPDTGEVATSDDDSDFERQIAGMPKGFIRSAMLVESFTEALGGEAIFGDFNHTASAGLFDSSVQQLPFGICAQIGDGVGNLKGRADIGANGDVLILAGAAGLTPITLPGGEKAAASSKDGAILAMLKAAIGSPSEPQPQPNPDRALFQSVIDGTVADILAPELADDLEAAYTRNQDDAELAALFEQAVTAYQAAMMAATASLA